jgi:hypothetical protein
MIGGMFMGAAKKSASTPQEPTSIVNNSSEPGSYAPYPPPGATPTQVNGTYGYSANGIYYRPYFNGSRVVYSASPM